MLQNNIDVVAVAGTLLFIHNISKKWVLLHDNNCAGNIKEIYSFELIFDINFWETVSQVLYTLDGGINWGYCARPIFETQTLQNGRK